MHVRQTSSPKPGGVSSLALVPHLPGFQATGVFSLLRIVLCSRDCSFGDERIVATFATFEGSSCIRRSLDRYLPLLRLDPRHLHGYPHDHPRVHLRRLHSKPVPVPRSSSLTREVSGASVRLYYLSLLALSHRDTQKRALLDFVFIRQNPYQCFAHVVFRFRHTKRSKSTNDLVYLVHDYIIL